MTLKDELLIPFRGAGEVGRSLLAGSAVLCRCAERVLKRALSAGWAAAWKGETAQDRLESLGIAVLAGATGGVVLALAGGELARLAAPYDTVIGWSAVGAWVLAALAVSPPVKRAPVKIVSGGGEAAPSAPDAAPPAPGTEPLDAATVARTVRKIAEPPGWKGAHLDDILAWLPGRSREELLQVLAEARIPITEQLKLQLPGGRQRNRQGVRLTALPPGLGLAPAPGPPTGPAQAALEEAPEAAPPPVPMTVYGTQ